MNTIFAASFQLPSTITKRGKTLADGSYLNDAFFNCSLFSSEAIQNEERSSKELMNCWSLEIRPIIAMD